MANSEAFTIGGAVEHTAVGMAIAKLLPGFGERVMARAGQFVFPADDARVGKPVAYPGKNFHGFRRRKMSSTGRLRSAVAARVACGRLRPVGVRRIELVR